MNKRQRKKALKRDCIAWVDFPLIVLTVIPYTENYKVLLHNLTEQRQQGKRKRGSWQHD